MDVYGDSPTIVTMWLTIIPKLSILILLLELYLQIDFFESFFIANNPFINYVTDISFLPEFISDFYQSFGGVEKYEAYRLAHLETPHTPADKIWETGVNTVINFNFFNILYFYNINPLDEFWNLFLNWHIFEGGGSDALYNLLFVSSLFSLIIGTVLGLAQSQIKRLLA